MNSKFECKDCQNIFETNGTKKEWNDPTYGYCWKYIANCPVCSKECSEYRKPKCNKNCCDSGSCGSCDCSCG